MYSFAFLRNVRDAQTDLGIHIGDTLDAVPGCNIYILPTYLPTYLPCSFGIYMISKIT